MGITAEAAVQHITLSVGRGSWCAHRRMSLGNVDSSPKAQTELVSSSLHPGAAGRVANSIRGATAFSFGVAWGKVRAAFSSCCWVFPSRVDGLWGSCWFWLILNTAWTYAKCSLWEGATVVLTIFLSKQRKKKKNHQTTAQCTDQKCDARVGRRNPAFQMWGIYIHLGLYGDAQPSLRALVLWHPSPGNCRAYVALLGIVWAGGSSDNTLLPVF